MKRKSTIRQIGQVLIGYFAVGVFILSFLFISAHAKDGLGLPASLSEATILTLAAVMTMPIVLPFVLERISKVKLGELEVDLLQVIEKVSYFEFDLEDFAAAIDEFEQISKAEPDEPEVDVVGFPEPRVDAAAFKRGPVGEAFREAEKTGHLVVNLGIGKNWLSTRLFLFAALAEDYTSIRQMIFFEEGQSEDRVFVGRASPSSVRQGLAWDNPRLKEAYEVAKRATTDALDKNAPESGVVWIITNYLRNLSGPNGEGGEWVTPPFLDRLVAVNKYCIEWNREPITPLLLHRILDRTEPDIVLVNSSGQLNLVIDRLKLAERIAKDSLRQRLE